MGRLSPFRDGCYCHCFGSEEKVLCGEHEGCIVTPQSCAWPECRMYREMHEEIGTGRVTLQ
jgi:hypothetical protein